MPYYRGDYGTGYYRGDPFSLTGLIGGIAKVGTSFVTGGPLAAIKTGVSLIKQPATLPRISTTPNLPIATLGTLPPAMIDVPRTTPGALPTPGLGGTISRILPGGKSGYEVGLRGYHMSKSGKIVKNRRMNVVNPRALRRAIRRASGFGKLVQRMKRSFARANTAVGNRHIVRRKGFGRR